FHPNIANTAKLWLWLHFLYKCSKPLRTHDSCTKRGMRREGWDKWQLSLIDISLLNHFDGPVKMIGWCFFSPKSICLPCNCKGHADYCEDITGICINCRDHSTGDFCEVCEDGYMLAPSRDGRHTCKPCACPLSVPSNNFAVHCDRGGAVLRCKCQEGYAGQFCERCAPGYYGNPMAVGNSCKRCDCNGNSDPNLIFSECHNVTGHCQHCWGNTAGANCERCASGFYGDAITAKNCRECDCESGHCDMHTGECLTEAAVNLCCDECIWHLIGDLRLSNKTLDQLKVGVLNISTGAAANDRLKYYNYTAHRLQVHIHIDVQQLWKCTFTDANFEVWRYLMMTSTKQCEVWRRGQASDVEDKLILCHYVGRDLRASDANGFVQRAISAANVYNNIVKYIDDANITSLTTLNLSQKAEEVCFKIQECLLSLCARKLLFVCFSVENLNVLVPELLDKLKVVEEKKPVNNVTTNIMRIRELIAQARSVAKKVQVSMKFNGQSSVEVHPHTNLEDLKTVTSISLYMEVDPDKDPIEDRFILYLGDRHGRKDYMGLAIKNDNLVYVYNLGGEDVEIPLASKPVSQWPAVFNYIKVERLGRHGKVFLTIPSQSTTDEQKFIQKGEAPGTDSLFDIDPKDIVFFVGGVPPNVRLPPPLSLAPFVGCIELESLNNDVISLYNFKATHHMDMTTSTPCPRYKLAFSQSRIASYLFDGTGYALINNMERRGKFGVVTRFDISVRTVANNGVLFLMVNGLKFFLLELKNGYLRLMYDFGFSSGPNLFEERLPILQINDAKYHEVSVIYHQSKKVILLVDKSHVKSMENPKTTLPFSDIHIGGAPSNILSIRSELSSVVGLKGCVKGFQFQKKDFNLLEEPGTIGISSGCPEESFMSRKAYLTGESYLGSTAKITPFDSFEGGLNFRTLQPSGLLFYHRDGTDEFSVSLENGGVVFNNRGTKVKSHKKQYSDGRTHFLVVSVNSTKYSLVVDDKDKQEKKRPASATRSSSGSSLKTFYYGGSPSSSMKNFTGCISYAYISRQDRDIEPEDFQRYTEKVNTSLQDCPVQRPPAALLSRPMSRTRQTQDRSSVPLGLMELKSDEAPSEADITPCYLSSNPRGTRQAYHYGGIANSRQHYTDLPESLSKRSHFSLSLKTQSSFGLIFYVSDAQEDNFMALFLAHGKLVYTFNVAEQRVKIKSDEKYNDGTWHNVVFIRDGNMGRLIIDGLTVLEDRAQERNVSWHVSSPLYVGGVPPGNAQKNIQRNSAYSFTGCLKNLQLDGQWLSSVSETFGVTQCFEGRSEAGTYFSAEGGYVMLDETFDLGLKFELEMELRPRVASGLLLHVSAVEGYFTMYIHEGAVVVLVNDGTHEFFTKVSPAQGLCSGSWHRVTVIRNANVVQLDVDSEVNHVVGPVNPNATDTRKPVFIGRAPGERSHTHMSFSSFLDRYHPVLGRGQRCHRWTAHYCLIQNF
uniref:Laminin, alpha 4 n=1 Tax=Sphaeramia orbicularis TaxID=375764 RepID=A0A673B3I5_9TELE